MLKEIRLPLSGASRWVGITDPGQGKIDYMDSVEGKLSDSGRGGIKVKIEGVAIGHFMTLRRAVERVLEVYPEVVCFVVMALDEEPEDVKDVCDLAQWGGADFHVHVL